MIHLIYISSATSWPSGQDLTELLVQARSRNSKKNITGMLLYGNATYMQVLEGDKKDVLEIYKSIQQDPRNMSVVTLVEEEISRREFPGWSMGFRNLTATTCQDLPGFTDVFKAGFDKASVVNNQGVAIKLLMNFAKHV